MKDLNIEISASRDKLKIADVQAMLSTTFWSPGITVEEISKGIQNSSLIVGSYMADQRQIGFLRVISDKVRFGYIMEVVVADEFRRKGIGQEMVRFAMAHPELGDVYQWLLITKDAHGVYEKCGFQKLQTPELRPELFTNIKMITTKNAKSAKRFELRDCPSLAHEYGFFPVHIIPHPSSLVGRMYDSRVVH